MRAALQKLLQRCTNAVSIAETADITDRIAKFQINMFTLASPDATTKGKPMTVQPQMRTPKTPSGACPAINTRFTFQEMLCDLYANHWARHRTVLTPHDVLYWDAPAEAAKPVSND